MSLEIIFCGEDKSFLEYIFYFQSLFNAMKSKLFKFVYVNVVVVVHW